jgi:hypothetical protein
MANGAIEKSHGLLGVEGIENMVTPYDLMHRTPGIISIIHGVLLSLRGCNMYEIRLYLVSHAKTRNEFILVILAVQWTS